MKKYLWMATAFVVIAAVLSFQYLKTEKIFSPLGNGKITDDKNFGQYSYTALQKTNFPGSEITIGKKLKDGDGFSSYIFYFFAKGKKVSGLINVPSQSGSYPVIVMIRGYVDPKIYSTGVGTMHGGELLAQNNFITLAPDFLGYGNSDKPSPDALEDRFLTYTTVMELLSSVKNLNRSFTDHSIPARFDEKHVGIWGHSNGGQIALSILEISGKNYPTVLWAPVSKPFPYSVLYYTDDIDDHGKALRKVVAEFEQNYNSENYSLTNYFDWIRTPVQIHQGGADEAVPIKWSDDLVAVLKKKNKDVEYFTYPEEDHNFDQAAGWNLAMQRTMDFYNKIFKNE